MEMYEDMTKLPLDGCVHVKSLVVSNRISDGWADKGFIKIAGKFGEAASRTVGTREVWAASLQMRLH